jgi:hypothetical protein
MTVTITPTITATPVITFPLTQVRLSEALPVTGTTYLDEWIELHNTGAITADIGGWVLTDTITATLPYTIPVGTLLPPGSYALLYKQVTGLNLDDGGDQLSLFDLTNTLVDFVSFGPLPPDTSYSRDDLNAWHADWPPSPGGPNLPPTPTATVTP